MTDMRRFRFEALMWRMVLVVLVVLVAFSSLPRILGDCSTTHSPPAVFLTIFLNNKFEMEVSSSTLISLLMPGSVRRSGSASRDDCGRMFPDK